MKFKIKLYFQWRILIKYIAIMMITFINPGCHINEKRASNQTDTIFSKTITFPDPLYLLENGKLLPIDSIKEEIAPKSKLISIVDGVCMKCIVGQLNNLDSLFNSIIIDQTSSIVVFILNVSPRDSAFFMKELLPYIHAKGILLWDNDYNFEKKNKLITRDINLRTFLVNDENRIILFGNPNYNPKILNTYQDSIIVLSN